MPSSVLSSVCGESSTHVTQALLRLCPHLELWLWGCQLTFLGRSSTASSVLPEWRTIHIFMAYKHICWQLSRTSLWLVYERCRLTGIKLAFNLAPTEMFIALYFPMEKLNISIHAQLMNEYHLWPSKINTSPSQLKKNTQKTVRAWFLFRFHCVN